MNLTSCVFCIYGHMRHNIQKIFANSDNSGWLEVPYQQSALQGQNWFLVSSLSHHHLLSPDFSVAWLQFLRLLDKNRSELRSSVLFFKNYIDSEEHHNIPFKKPGVSKTTLIMQNTIIFRLRNCQKLQVFKGGSKTTLIVSQKCLMIFQKLH